MCSVGIQLQQNHVRCLLEHQGRGAGICCFFIFGPVLTMLHKKLYIDQRF